MKKIIIASSVAVAMLVSSCTRSAIVPLQVTDNAVGTKVGTVKKKCWFNMCGNTNIGAAEAAKNGGIKKIATVDFKITSKFISTTYETIVTGE